MFGKIKDRLKNVFNKSEEVIEESQEEEFKEEPISDEKEEKKVKKEKTKKEKTQKKKEENKEFEDTKKEEKESSKGEDISQKVDEKEAQIEEKEKEEELKQEEIEELLDEENSEEESPEEEFKEESISDEKEEKKGFFSRVFSKKEKEDLDEDESAKEEGDEKIEDLEVQEENKEQADEKDRESSEEDLEESDEKTEEKGFLKKTFGKLTSKKISKEDFQKIWIELEIFLLEINIAYEIVSRIEERLKETVVDSSFDRFSLTDAIRKVMTEEVEKVLIEREAHFLEKIKEELKLERPLPLLVLGVNGTGKTTTLAKIVHYFKKHDISCVLAAADTFRAAAREQLEEHAKKLEVKLIQHKSGSDPAAVAYDAVEHARAKNIDVVLIDTAGRMPNNSNLMMELQKVARVSKSRMSVFIGDSISGNDLIEQIELFSQGVSVDGIILTKVDTDEKPGSVVTAAYSIEKPIFFLGVGQTYDDLVEFNAKHIAKELFKLD